MTRIKEVKKQRRSAHQTQWTAQFAVASELCKRGYEVALTMGNHPALDLMVISPKGVHFAVDVKGLYKRNPWLVKNKDVNKKLFYVFALVSNQGGNQFSVLTQHQVRVGIQTNSENAKARRSAKGLSPLTQDKFSVVDWKFAENYRDRWDALPR